MESFAAEGERCKLMLQEAQDASLCYRRRKMGSFATGGDRWNPCSFIALFFYSSFHEVTVSSASWKTNKCRSADGNLLDFGCEVGNHHLF